MILVVTIIAYHTMLTAMTTYLDPGIISGIISAAPEIVQLGPVKGNLHKCIRFNIRGYPSPNLTWLHWGSVMNKPKITMDPRWRDGRDAHELIGCLYFDTPSHFSNGQYTVVATNAYGNDSRSMNATILDPPGRHSGNSPWDEGSFQFNSIQFN